MSEWQDISTAPKDGSVIILAGERSVNVCAWGPQVKGDSYPWVIFEGVERHFPTGCCDNEDGERVEVNGWMEDGPKFWMPLPSPPKAPVERVGG